MPRTIGLAITLCVTAVVAGCSNASSGGSTPAQSKTGAVNLVLGPAIRAELIHAQAQVENLADSAYTGFYKGTAYYAVDRDTGTYWAAGSLLPSKHSLRAQVSVQDEGGYLLFEKKPGDEWQVYNVGLEGEPDATACPVRPPADVLNAWRWKAKSCNPPFN